MQTAIKPILKYPGDCNVNFMASGSEIMYNWGSQIVHCPALLETAGAVADSCKGATDMESLPQDSVSSKPCSKCGQNLRQGKKPWCKACVDEYNHAYYAANRERLQAQQRKYEAAHRQDALDRNREWRKKNSRSEQNKRHYAKHRQSELVRGRAKRAANLEGERARARDYYRRNPEKFKPLYHKRRAMKLGNGGTYTSQEWRNLCVRYNHTCLCCGKQEPEIKLTPDHVTPLSKGGRNDIANIQPLCRACNISKNARTIDYRGNHDND